MSLTAALSSLNIDNTQRTRLYDVAMTYLLKACKSSDFEREVRENSGLAYQEAKDFRMALIGQFEYVGALKAWALRQLLKPSKSLREAMADGVKVGAQVSDMQGTWPRLQRMLKGLAVRRRDTVTTALKAVIHMLKTNESSRIVLDPEAAREVMGIVEPAIRKHAKRRAWSKMRFISSSQNEEIGDLAGGLVTQALQRFWWMLPTDKSALHITNSLRTAVNGFVVNHIQWHTAKCRSRLDADGVGGFTLRTVSQNQIGSEVQYHELASEESIAVDTTKPSENKLAVLAISKYVEDTKGPKTNKLLFLLTGCYDKEFSAFLTQQSLPDNDELFDAKPMAFYVEKAAEFCGLRHDRAESFLTDLRTRFG